MSKYYYNGILLPEISAEKLVECPYCFIVKSQDGTIKARLFAVRCYVDSSNTIGPSTPATMYQLAYNEDSDRWTVDSRAEAASWRFNLITEWELIWSNHDIPNGSATATAIYFSAREPVPYPDLVFEDYAIKRESLTAIGDAIRGKTGKTELLTLDSMVTEINSIEAGSSSANMFASNAFGRIPEYEKGTASSAFTLDFESSATGALQEG